MAFGKLGSERTVNSTKNGNQSDATAIQLLNGDIVVAWTDESTSSNAADILSQRLDDSGLANIGGTLELNAVGSKDQTGVALAALGNGGFIAGWSSHAAVPAGVTPPFDDLVNEPHSYAATREFNASGSALGGESTHYMAASKYSTDFKGTGAADISEHFQTDLALSANLTVGGSDFDLFYFDKVDKEIHPLIDGVFYNLKETEHNIIWDNGTERNQAVAAVEDETWSKADSISLFFREIPINYVPPADFHDISSITLDSGEAVLVYARAGWGPDGAFVDFGANRSTVKVGSTLATNPHSALLPDGGVVVVWSDTRNASDGFYDIRAQIFNADGSKRGGEFAVTQTLLTQRNSSVGVLPDGRFLVAWTDESETGGDTSGKAIKAQMFSAEGQKSGVEFLVTTATAGDQTNANVLGLQNGTFFVTWTDQGGADNDIKSQVFDPATYDGGDADETVYGGDTDDVFFGGGGDDTLLGKDGADTLNGESGSDVLEGNKGADILNGDDGADIMKGGADDDTYFLDNANDDVVEKTDEGIDTVWTYRSYTAEANVEIVRSLLSVAGTITGNSLDNDLHGSSLADEELDGKGGADILTGNGGNDTLIGGRGGDILDGGSGLDVLSGGKGDDTYIIGNAEAVPDFILEDAGTGSNDRIEAAVSFTNVANVERMVASGSANITLTGLDHDEDLIGNSGNNVLLGGGGDDFLKGRGGADTLNGGSGVDTADYSDSADAIDIRLRDGTGSGGGAAGDTLALIENIIGSSHDDEISGDNEANSLDGGGGSDILLGGNGADVLTGGQGDDVFEYGGENHSKAGEANRDIITDFSQVVGNRDLIDLTGLGGLSFVSGGEFTGENQVIARDLDGDTLIRINLTGPDNAEMDIVLAGVAVDSITAADFMF